MSAAAPLLALFSFYSVDLDAKVAWVDLVPIVFRTLPILSFDSVEAVNFYDEPSRGLGLLSLLALGGGLGLLSLLLSFLKTAIGLGLLLRLRSTLLSRDPRLLLALLPRSRERSLDLSLDLSRDSAGDLSRDTSRPFALAYARSRFFLFISASCARSLFILKSWNRIKYSSILILD